MLRDILSDKDDQVAAMVRVIRAADPDILVLADLDFDLEGRGVEALAMRVGGYPHHMALRPNRGLQTGVDRDGDGRHSEPEDAQGYGEFAGQGGMAVLSRLPLLKDQVEDHSNFLWRDLPENLGHDAAPDQRLATTGFHVVPARQANGEVLRLLAWHATAPVFDGPEDFNGRRNHDEAAFWSWYLSALTEPSGFVLLGTANLDTADGDGRPDALMRLLRHPFLQDPLPQSRGAPVAAATDGGVNDQHTGDPALDTADWPDGPGQPGNLRVDYVLPSRSFDVLNAGVFWPGEGGSLLNDVIAASRHRLVWVDLVDVRQGSQQTSPLQ